MFEERWYEDDDRQNKKNEKKDNKKENNMNRSKPKSGLKKVFMQYGKVENGELALTLNGQIAVKRNEGEYIRYNAETETMENQMDMVIKEASDLIYIIPTNDIQVGDIIKNKQTYYQILHINDNGSLKAVSIKNGTKKTILKETNIFGLSFYYKVISLFTNDNANNSTSMESFNPMMLMLLNSDNEDDNLLPLLMMNNQTTNNSQINPMMLMMMGKHDNEDTSNIKNLILMQMMSTNQNNMQGLNPMMLLAMQDGEMDIKTLLMMQMMNNQQNNQLMGGNV